MVTHELTVVVSEAADVARMELVGHMNFETVSKFRVAMLKAAQKAWHDVVIDCSRLEYVDSSAMGNILYWRSKLQEHQREISFVNCSGVVLQAFKIGGFHKLFKMH
jgi:anti-sigma B factor antagonist